jgi:hypothetical protein
MNGLGNMPLGIGQMGGMGGGGAMSGGMNYGLLASILDQMNRQRQQDDEDEKRKKPSMIPGLTGGSILGKNAPGGILSGGILGQNAPGGLLSFFMNQKGNPFGGGLLGMFGR